VIFVTDPMDVNNSKVPSKFAGKNLRLTVIIVVVAVIIFAMWLFFISGEYDPYYDNNMLPPNCYSLNGKQVCPNP
jgi:hypothetical protein